MVVQITDVEALDKNGWQNLTDAKKTALLEDARAERDSIYSGRVSTTPILEGDEDVFTKNLAAHKWELAEGGEAQTEGAGGGNVTYNTVTGDILDYLTETRYGRTALAHLDTNQSTGVVTSF